MFVLGHVGIAAAAYFTARRGADQDAVLSRPELAMLAVGSMLPDLIDKPIGHLLLPALNNGRLVAHTLLFFVGLGLIAVLIGRRYWRWTVPLVAGSGIHLLLDRVWESTTLFWPATGWSFPAYDGDVIAHWLAALTTDPYVLGGEIIGTVALGVISVPVLKDLRCERLGTHDPQAVDSGSER